MMAAAEELAFEWFRVIRMMELCGFSAAHFTWDAF
jgi:hypothetical protein